MMQIKNTTTLKHIATILLFLSVLLAMRLTWSELFSTSDHPRAVNGVLDMRGWDLEKSPTISLNGQWEFYPSKLINHQDVQLPENQASYIQVPGDWSIVLTKRADTSICYGTYRIRILIDPLEQPASFWLQKIQASSGVEINGLVENDFGKPADNADEYTPKNVSYTASYSVKGTEELELLI
jgi:two-component system sensor histidine kinase ChiS